GVGVAGVAVGGVAGHAQVQEPCAGRDAALILRSHAGRRSADAGDDAGDVSPVAIAVGDVWIALHEADARHDLVRQRRVRADAGVDDGDADPRTVDAGNRADAEQSRLPRPGLLAARRLIRDAHIRGPN